MSSKLKKKRKEKDAVGEICRYLLQYETILSGVLICLILPLALKNGYYKIGDFKFKVYAWLCGGSIAVILVTLVFYLIGIRKDIRIKDIPSRLSVTDKFVIAYFLLIFISWLLNGKYLKDNLMGYPGWFMGLFAQFTFFFIFLAFSRFAKDQMFVIAALVFSSAAAYGFGILHRLMIDPLHTYEGIDSYYYMLFLSTLGQNSWYSSFICSFLPFMMAVYIISEKRGLRIFVGVFCIEGFMTLISQNTDSAYLAVMGTFLLLLYFCSDTALKMRQLCELAFGFLMGGKLMQLLLIMHPNEYLDVDEITDFLMFSPLVWLLIAAVAIVWAVFFMLDKKKIDTKKPLKLIRRGVYAIVVLFVIASAMILVLGAKGRLSQSMTGIISKMPYLTWSYEWGNGRGFTWTVTWKMITEFSPLKLLFGVGPDGYAKYGYEFYQDLIRSVWGENILTNAHNEWLNMIVDGGLLGGVAYAGIYISAMVRFAKRSKELPVLICFAACIASYMCHNLFCYQQVLCTPFIFILMAFGEYRIRNMEGTAG
ncbi:MAG: O-antigen ligase family protein [Lachnospiraceae bacterium]|nr:O-antigen ligase family protein [Lachnospiraceae bacterium]